MSRMHYAVVLSITDVFNDPGPDSLYQDQSDGEVNGHYNVRRR